MVEQPQRGNRGMFVGKSKLLLGVVITILVSANSVPAHSCPKHLSQRAKRSITQPHPKFRYLIITNQLVHSGRVVFVLLDRDSFSETNLREVFLLVSKRFPKPDQLSITVCTSLEQLPTPEEFDYIRSAPDDNSLPFFTKVDQYPSADYTRLKGKEAFEYSMGDGKPKKTVVIEAKNTSIKSKTVPHPLTP